MPFIQTTIKNPTRSLTNINKASATVMTTGFVLEQTAGLAVLGTAATTRATMAGVCNQTIAAAEALTQVPVIETFEKDTWTVDSTNNSDATHNGQLMVLGASGGIVNNTGTTNAAGIVKQEGVYGTAAEKKIIVSFVQ